MGILSKISNVTSLASLEAAADTSDYKSAQDRLDEAARLNGPLNVTIGDLRRNFSQQSQLQRAARQEETLWDQAMKHMQAAEFDDAEKLLRELIALPEAGQHRPDAERYVDETIPQRRYEDLLWSDLQQYARSLSPDHLENELKTLDKILILGGSRQQQANRVRQALIAQLAEASAMKNRKPLAAVPDWGRAGLLPSKINLIWPCSREMPTHYRNWRSCGLNSRPSPAAKACWTWMPGIT